MTPLELTARFVDLCSGLGASGTILPAALFAAGLASGVTHCAGMCGPFVLGQVAAASRDGRGPTSLAKRARVGALVPYHLGRATTYGLLGAASGGVVGSVGASWAGPLLLVAAAALLVAQAVGTGLHPTGPRAGRWARALLRLGGGGNGGFALGCLLGLLPCGVLYAAITAAAAAGGPLQGALAMLAFAIGTVPGLFAVGFAGHALARTAGPTLRYAAITLLLLNAGTLGSIALASAP